MVNFVDAVKIAGTRRRAEDGALIVDARTARTGIQVYAGVEVGKPSMSTVRVYRPPEEVFAADSLASFAHRPVTNDHPAQPVTVDTWRAVAVGQTGDEVARDGEFVRVPMMVSDAETIASIESGKRELSAGYRCDLDWTSGVTADGETYDAMQRNIRVNHVAIVDRGRAGSQVRIGDDAENWGVAPIVIDQKGKRMSVETRMITFDGLPIVVTDQAAAAIEKLQKTLADAYKEKDEMAAKREKLEEDIGKMKAELDKMKDAAPTPEMLDAMVQKRAEIVRIATAFDAEYKAIGKTDAQIRREIVAKRMGDEAVKDVSDAEVSGMFAVISRDAGKDPFRDAKREQGANPPANDHGYGAHVRRLADAWKEAK